MGQILSLCLQILPEASCCEFFELRADADSAPYAMVTGPWPPGKTVRSARSSLRLTLCPLDQSP
ncbi:hypothetical protein [Bifidobacterium asteroides]|uniref:hypothetical protein n=1 Tax=Bifidobacterium TaxID=1678 RepID=UPI0011B7BE27|nr:hypothetical protein [Bifidobacterium asteroides]